MRYPLTLTLSAFYIALCASAPVAAQATAEQEKTGVQEQSVQGAQATEETKPSKAAQEDEPKTKTPKRKKVRLALFTLTDQMPESPGKVGPFGDMQVDLRKTVDRLEKAAEDDSIKGAILRIQQPAIGRGRVYELRGAIKRFRGSGKKAYAELEMATPVDYMIASACDEIVMPESGFLMLPGIHAETTFYKGMFDKIGVEADFMHIGPYKGAAQPYMRKELSPEVRENMTSLIDDLYDQLLTTIANDRLLTVDQVRKVVDQGIITAQDAKEVGLIDRLQYADDLRSDLADDLQAEPLVYVENYGKQEVDTDFSGPMGFVKLMKLMAGVNPDSGRKKGKKIAVIYASGPIMTGKSEQDPFGSSTLGSTTLIEALRKADKDKKVVAIVLRINSPGGSAVASDLIWRETQRIKKPIIASMGDVAGSGGYYIAMGADKIYAAPGTITGSIGVVTGKFAVRGLFDKIGISTDTISRGQNSGLFGSSGKFSDTERSAMKAFMEDIYGQFTRKAADGREMSLEDLQSLAEGRIYTGRQAKRNGLIDELGTLDDAINAAKLLAGLDSDEEVRLKLLPEPVNFFESMFGNMDAEREIRLPTSISGMAPQIMEQFRKVYQLQQVFEGPAALVMPFELEIR